MVQVDVDRHCCYTALFFVFYGVQEEQKLLNDETVREDD